MARSSANGSFKNLARGGVNVMVVVFMCFMLASPYGVAVQATEVTGPEVIQFYVHEQRAPPGATVKIATPAGGSFNEWGTVILFDNKVTETAAPNSTLIGRQFGTVAVGIDNASFFADFSIHYNTTDCVGGISLAGISPSTVVAVTGGSGCFSFASGLAYVLTLVNTATNALFLYTIELKYS